MYIEANYGFCDHCKSFCKTNCLEKDACFKCVKEAAKEAKEAAKEAKEEAKKQKNV